MSDHPSPYDTDAVAAESSTPPVVTGSPRTAGFAAPTTGVGDYLKQRWGAVKAGELGALPIILGLIIIVLIFGVLEEQFLTARNFTNLLLQMAPVAALAMGIVFILLIADGEVVSIDLSVAFVAAVGGVVMTLLQRPGDPGWPWWACILGAVVVTTAIGLLHCADHHQTRDSIVHHDARRLPGVVGCGAVADHDGSRPPGRSASRTSGWSTSPTTSCRPASAGRSRS